MAQLKDLLVNGASRFIGPIYGNLTGNADTATRLNISTSGYTGTADNCVSTKGDQFQVFKAGANSGADGADGYIMDFTWSSPNSYGAQIFIDADPTRKMSFRQRNASGEWTSWNTIIHNNNYNSYSPTLTGGGASGTWGINITGTAAGLSTTIANDKLPPRLREYVHLNSPGNCNSCHNGSGWYYTTGNSTTLNPFYSLHMGQQDYMILDSCYSSVWGSQIAVDFRSPFAAVRNINNGTWSAWSKLVGWVNHDTQISTSDMNNPNYGYPYEIPVSSAYSPSIGLTNNWWHLKNFRHGDNNGYNAQMALSLNHNMNMMKFRTSSGMNWRPWTNVSTSDDGYVSQPGGATYHTTTSSITGALCITMPQSWTSTMIRFKVQIFDYYGTSVLAEYEIGGYNYSGSPGWMHAYDARSHGSTVDLADRTVRFGHNGNVCCVYIGETNSVWHYPQVVVTDVHGGYSNWENVNWSDRWGISFVTSFGTITATTTHPSIIRPYQCYGAVWNDYAEYRQANSTEPGRCVIEKGDDTLTLSTERLQRGAEIISDTFGFAIGETDECKTPIAAAGRVLAYGYESREEFASHIGCPVCSGPNGTVSIMTDEEEEKYPSRIIGFISAVPDYEEWGTGNVKVDGRIWIRVR